MLESRALFVRPAPASRPGNSAGPTAEILDAVTGRPLGTVRRQPHRERWWAWLVPAALTIHEAGDEPLLFTLRRRWRFSYSWSVLDADDQPIGTLCQVRLVPYAARVVGAAGLLILDRYSRLLATLCRSTEATGEGAVLDPEGVTLATLREQPAGAELTFTPASENEPFLRMLVLAAVLRPLAE